MPQAERYYGAAKRGRVWDRLLREYYYVRVIMPAFLRTETHD